MLDLRRDELAYRLVGRPALEAHDETHGDDSGNWLAASSDGTKVFGTGQSYGGAGTGSDALTAAYQS